MKKTLILKISSKKPDKKKIAIAAAVLRKGGLVAFPTETVYGIAANLLNKKAIKRLYSVKKRPKGKPFTVHVSGEAMVRKMGCPVRGMAKKIIKKYWPGPLTVILKSASGKKIGFRMPANRIAMELIKNTGAPVIAPSANLSGKRAPKTAKEVLRELDGKIDILIDGGRTRFGVASTVLDLTTNPPKVLREGVIKKLQITNFK